MKVLMSVFLLLLFPVLAFGTTLTCDVYPDTSVTVTTIEVEMDYNSIITPSTVPYSTQLFNGQPRVVLMNLDGRPNGLHRFRARWVDAGGWWSDWSNWFPFVKLEGIGGPFRIMP